MAVKARDNRWHLRDCKSKRYLTVEEDFTYFVAKLTKQTDPFLPVPALVRTEVVHKGNRYHGSCDYQGGVWRDWVRVEWEGHGQLPNKIWGFVDLSAIRPNNNLECGGLFNITPGIYAIVESAEEKRPKNGEYKSQLFTFVTKEVGRMQDNRVQNTQFYLADVDAFVEQLIVVPDIGGAGNSYLLVSPRSQWANDFEKWLQKPYEKMEPLLDSDEEDSEETEEDDEHDSQDSE